MYSEESFQYQLDGSETVFNFSPQTPYLVDTDGLASSM